MEQLGFRGAIQHIHVEMHHDDGRSDVIVQTNVGRGVIEAKISPTDPDEQSRRYPARWRVLLTPYIATRHERSRARCTYLTWQELSDHLQSEGVLRSRDAKIRFVANDIRQYLQEHGMISERDPAQVYAREINNVVTLKTFLQCNVYTCLYQPGARLPKMSHFAPHFGQSISLEYPGVRVGISYIAEIKHVELAEQWEDVVSVLRKHRSNRRWKILLKYKDQWASGWNEKRSVLLLGEPRLVFNPPIVKSHLQKGSGWLSKRFFSFDQLFAAWLNEKPN